jgi:ubiquitin-like 1-activating enzyme E1 B
MAGNIIPAIATTNAIVAGLVVMKALAVLKDKTSLNQSFLRQATNWPIKNGTVEQPNPACAVCNDVYIPFKVDLKRLTLGNFVEEVVQGWLQPAVAGNDDFEVTIMEGGRVLADPDFKDNYGRTLADLGVTRGQYLSVADEDSVYCRIHFCIAAPDEGAVKAYTLPEVVPEVPKRPTPGQALSEASEDEIVIRGDATPAPPSAKRPAEDDSETPAKKHKTGADVAHAIEIE